VRRATFPVPIEELDRPLHSGPEVIVLEDLSSRAAANFVEATLPPDQADVVLLRVLGGLSVTEVSEILGKPPGTVRVLQHRALRRLQAELAKSDVTQ
jgi:RNA polymerase sigma-70 factor (ECF subfamily)